MTPAQLPALFLSHGAPTLALQDNAVTRAWSALADATGRPASILVVSAHWDTGAPVVTGAPRLETIHDYAGFPEALYRLSYEPPGSPELAARVSSLLAAAGQPAETDRARGIDHGGWVPLRWMYPQADIPVVQLSVQSQLGARHHLLIGSALAPLRAEGVLVIGSGGIVHNLRELDWMSRTAAGELWATAFNDWMAHRIAGGDREHLADYRRLAPSAGRAHPSEEHLVPLYVAMGAGGFPARRIALGFAMGSLGMDAYAFG